MLCLKWPARPARGRKASFNLDLHFAFSIEYPQQLWGVINTFRTRLKWSLIYGPWLRGALAYFWARPMSFRFGPNLPQNLSPSWALDESMDGIRTYGRRLAMSGWTRRCWCDRFNCSSICYFVELLTPHYSSTCGLFSSPSATSSLYVVVTDGKHLARSSPSKQPEH